MTDILAELEVTAGGREAVIADFGANSLSDWGLDRAV
jgi:hypothetical protein